MLPKFTYQEPKTIQEVCALLAADPKARILSGGTDLIVNIKHGVVLPTTVINLKRLPGLDSILFDHGRFTIGPLVKLKSLYTHPEIIKRVPALAAAASSVGSYHHQVMGTVGGNLCQENRCRFLNQSAWWRSSKPACIRTGGDVCHVVKKSRSCFACYQGDLAPVLIVLKAEIHLAGTAGVRSCSVEELFSGDGRKPLTLLSDEIVTGITISVESGEDHCEYYKFADRGSIDFPIVGVACWASTTNKTYRICFTAVDRKPVRAKQAETFLKGKDLDDRLLEQAADLADKEAQPMNNCGYSPAYKRMLMQRMLGHVVRHAIGEIKS